MLTNCGAYILQICYQVHVCPENEHILSCKPEACPNSKWSLDGMEAGAEEAAAQMGRISLFRRILDNHCPGFPLKLVVWDRENESKAIQICHFI